MEIGSDAALVGPNRLLQHREQEAPLGRRKTAGKELIGEDEIRLELHAADLGPRATRSRTSSTAGSHGPDIR